MLRGVLYDLPHVGADARALITKKGLSERCAMVEGSFFESVPSGGDVYMMSHVIHDWDEASCVRVLQHCRSAMHSRSRLILVEMVIPPGSDFHPSKVLDLVEEKRCSRLLADGRRMKIIAPGDQAWVEREWLPRSKRAGIRYSALILPKSVVSTMAVNRIMERFTSTGGKEVEITRAYFEDVPSAKAWLRSVPG